MLTKNFYNIMMRDFTKKTMVGVLRDTSGVMQDAYWATGVPGKESLCWLNNLIADDSVTEGVRIGSGVTPATVDDYKMENVLTNFTATKPSDISVCLENGYVMACATYGITNTGTTAMAISEIGLFGSVGYASSRYGYFLLDHTILESPITINPGQTKQVTYSIRMNYPVE